jgi:hypothetical protein
MADSFSMPYCCKLHTVRVHEGHPSQVVKLEGRRKASFILSYHVAENVYKARSEVNFQSIFIFRTSSQIAGLRPILMTGLCQCRADRNARSSQCPLPLGATRIFHLICGTMQGRQFVHPYIDTLYTSSGNHFKWRISQIEPEFARPRFTR